MSLIVSVSGVRGVIGDTLTPYEIIRFTGAFAKFCSGGKIMVGRDTRIHSEMISKIVVGTLLFMGCEVVDLGICPTPTIQLAVEHSDSDGGVMITASHNPSEWNGLKFLSSEGIFLTPEQHKKFIEIAKSGNFNFAKWNKIGKLINDETFIEQHIERILKIDFIDLEKIRSRNFKVVVDCINGAGSKIVPMLLEKFGCEVIKLNCDGNGIFTHEPEPLPENLTELCETVRKTGADLGIAVDPDADRVVFVTEKGEPFGEEYTVVQAVKIALEKKKSLPEKNIVVNLSTTKAVDEIAKKYGANVYRSPVGEINVVMKMKGTKAIIGGEGSGGVILPDVHYGRDSLVGIALILQNLVEFGGKISEFKESLPKFEMVKEKINIAGVNPDEILKKAIELFKKSEINTEDGVRIDFEDAWIHIRKSNTEPILRIISEARTKQDAENLVKKLKMELHL
ncbi:phosphomannomutase [Candidatus Thermokryptus mobilis]|uniref:Phosphomannomutase n=1 Tax=Candidatus Thermokryptus mobilis TaxID=1643428 RepID=A0A0S4MV98_9BACT|nr:phosphoglucosamine mutase [Candidatus Thermokryptus mobilis]CUU01871.1 phosphomannomutase [Candidatus Thermokryptus mobilis]